jgi:hypothetical protein
MPSVPVRLLDPLLRRYPAKTDERLRADNSPHVLCFVGHGRFPTGLRVGTEEPAIFMANAANKAQPVRASDFADSIRDGWGNSPNANLRLVMLVSCETAMGEPEAAGSGGKDAHSEPCGSPTPWFRQEPPQW